MSLKEQITQDMKAAMRAKDKLRLEAIRAVKSAILLEETKGTGTVSDDDLIKVLTKLVKQRKESAQIYADQDRQDSADEELAQAKVIESYLPQQLSDEELTMAIANIVSDLGVTSPKEMGKVMGVANKQLAGKAEGKRIADAVKKALA